MNPGVSNSQASAHSTMVRIDVRVNGQFLLATFFMVLQLRIKKLFWMYFNILCLTLYCLSSPCGLPCFGLSKMFSKITNAPPSPWLWLKCLTCSVLNEFISRWNWVLKVRLGEPQGLKMIHTKGEGEWRFLWPMKSGKQHPEPHFGGS